MSDFPDQPKNFGLPIWWVVSILFHAVLLTWLIFFSPVRVIDLTKKPSAAANVSPARAKEIVEKMSEKQAENLAADVRDLQSMKQQLNELEAAKREEFEKFTRDFSKNAPEEAAKAQAAAAKAQADALAAQAKLDAGMTNALMTKAEAELKQLDKLQNESTLAQTRAKAAQSVAFEKLDTLDARFKEAQAAQAEAKAAQDRAAAAQDAARKARGNEVPKPPKDRRSDIESATENIKRAEQEVAKADADIAALTNQLAAASSAVTQAQSNTVSSASAPQAARTLQTAQKQTDQLKSKISQRQSQQEKAAARIPVEKERLEKFQAEATGVPRDESDEKITQLQAAARERQMEAQQAQARAATAFAAAQKLPASAAPATIAHEEAEKAQAAAEKAQAEALAAAARMTASVTNAMQAKSPAELQKLNAEQAEAAAAQARANEAQERALDKLAVSDTRFTEAYQAQNEANAEQRRAAAALAAARAASDEVKSKEATQRSSEVASARAEVTNAEQEAARAAEEIRALTNQIAAERSAIKQANTNSPASVKAQESAKKQLSSFESKLAQRQSQHEKFVGRVADRKARLEKIQAEAGGARPTPTADNVAKLHNQARERQADAQKKQSQASAALAAAKKQAAPNDGGIASMPKLDPKSAGASAKVDQMDLPKLYDTALKTEEELAESYRRLRATELAMIRNIPLADALQATDSVKVNRPEFQSALTNTVDFEAAREAIQNTRSEIKSIHQLGSSLLAQARGLDRSGSRSAAGASLSPGGEPMGAIANAQNLEALAAEDDNMRAKDLTAAMKLAGKSGGAGSGKKSGKSGGGAGAGAGGAGGAGAGGAGGGGGGGTGASSGFGVATGRRGGVPTGVGLNIAAMPGRTVASHGESPGWMFVDSWYILGPFDNPGRANIDKQFPPETVVDRNGTYYGKGGTALQWEFYQAHEAKIMPPFRGYNAGGKRGLEYVIYYAATEMFFEEACDLWVAIGSDDFSKVWINEQLIWASGKGSKSWRADEGLRKVHFTKGVNRILYRVENGHGPTEFSFIVGMP